MNNGATIRPILPFIQLTKPVISVSVACSALTGFLLCQGSFATGWLIVTAGVLLLSAGSSTINHIQESKLDLLMDRTRLRPIPSGVVSKQKAWIFSVVLIAGGMALLLKLDSLAPAFLGLINIVWYNGVYTPLKKITAYAAIPGAVVGAIPPLIGWSAAGCNMAHHHAILLAFLFFIGQIPHFWLILLKNAGDYEKAGFPTLTRIFSPQQIANVTFIWVLSTAMAAIMLVLFDIIKSQPFIISVYLIAFFLLVSFRKWFNVKSLPDPHRAFINLNIFYALIMSVLVADALLA